MLKLLIVDDEVLVRIGLKSTIDWKASGYEIIGDADNGEKALEICRQKKPDIVITDIRMPKMDGLQLMRILKVECPYTKVIVLSCYNDIELVREAMQFYGALDYIPKLSMQPQDLIETMNNVKIIIENEKKKEDEILKLKAHSNNQKMEMKGFINDIIDGRSIDKKILNEFFKQYGLDISQYRSYIAICFKIDDFKRMSIGDKTLNLKRNSIRFIDVLESLLTYYEIEGQAFAGNEEQYGVFLCFKDQLNTAFIKDDLSKFCRDVIEKIKKEIEISVSAGISRAFDNFENLRSAYGEAEKAADFRIFKGKGSVNSAEDCSREGHACCFSNREEKLLREAIEKNNKEEALQIVLGVLENMKYSQVILPEKVHGQCLEIIYTFSSNLKQFDGNIQEIKDERGYEPYKSISLCETIDELGNWFREFTANYFNILHNCKNKKYGIDISRAVDFIKQHYKEDIKLNDVAEHISMNETYLSHLFKRETGLNFTDYINNIRIDKAKEYLKDNKLSISMISELVGYSSDSYFSKVFKLIVGLPPIEYKKQKSKK